jgi:hypothetical protein
MSYGGAPRPARWPPGDRPEAAAPGELGGSRRGAAGAALIRNGKSEHARCRWCCRVPADA